MSIRTVCPHCGKSLKAPDTLAGKRVRCPSCSQPLEISDSDGRAEHQSNTTAQNPHAHASGERRAVGNRSRSPSAKTANRIEPPPDEPPSDSPVAIHRTESRKRSSVKEPTPKLLHWLFVLTLAPLAVSFFSGASDTDERVARTIAAHPELLAQLDPKLRQVLGSAAQKSGLSAQDAQEMAGQFALMSALEEGRLDSIEGAHLLKNTWMHWIYAAMAALAFWIILILLFPKGNAAPIHLLLVGIATATLGLVFLLSVQWLADKTEGFWVRGRSVVAILFYILKFIGFSYRSALDPDTGFLLSFLGFTFGVGLCEELAKALPVFFHYFGGDGKLDERGACLWGLASGVGFGVAEGIIYSSDYYNGIALWDIYLVRFVSCVALHAIWTATVSLTICRNQSAFEGNIEWSDLAASLLRVLGVAMVLHGLYDTMLKREMNVAAMVVGLVSFVWLAWFVQSSQSTFRTKRRKGGHF